MTTIPPFTMTIAFKIAFTNCVQYIEISSKSTIHNLFIHATDLFVSYIDYNYYYIDFVICGQQKNELSPSFCNHKKYYKLEHVFGHNKHNSFYIRLTKKYPSHFI
jgi:hypothetical protein